MPKTGLIPMNFSTREHNEEFTLPPTTRLLLKKLGVGACKCVCVCVWNIEQTFFSLRVGPNNES